MKMYAIAVHYNSPDKKKIVGFRILELHSSDVKDYPYNAVKNVLLKKVAPIEGLTLDNKTKEIKGSNGSLERYPALIGGNPINRSLVILNSIDDKGYQVSSFNGKTAFATRSEVVAFALKAGIANGKIVDKDGKKFISAISGTYSNIPFNGSGLAKRRDIQMKKNDAELMKKQQEMINEKKRRKATYIAGPKVINGKQVDNSLMQMVDDITELTVEQKMAYVMTALKVIRPFCYSVYLCLNRVVTTDVSTMGVTLRSLYFNPYFVLETSLQELIFITIHEIYHVSMKHKIRCQKRRHSIWNKACDYYINKQIAEEFGLEKPGDTKQATIGNRNTGYKISLPISALFNSKVDTDTDTPEKLYEELLDIETNAEQQKSNSNGKQSSDSQDSSGQSEDSSEQDQSESEGNNSSSENGDSQEQGDQDEQNEQGEQNEQDRQDGQDGQGEQEEQSKQGKQGKQGGKSEQGEQDEQGEQGKQNDKSENNNESDGADTSDLDRLADGMDPSDESKKQSDIMSDSSEDKESNEDHKKSKNKSSKSNSDSSEDEEGNEDSKQSKNKSDKSSENEGESENEDELAGQEFRGSTIPNIESDIVNSPDEKAESLDRAEQIANSLLKRAASVCRQQTGNFGGEAGSWLERYVEKALAPKILWTSILRNKLTLASQKINTFSAPDKRFRSRGMILPGPKKIENDTLENVKICIDTSGSIGPKDLGIALAQIDQLLNTFKADAELLYWDTQIRAIYPFKNIKDIIDKQPLGGGGTDANCIFEYFETDKDYRTGRKKKPSIIIIFTDGCFGSIERKYSKYRDTIWVIQGNSEFKAPFGTVAPFKPE